MITILVEWTGVIIMLGKSINKNDTVWSRFWVNPLVKVAECDNSNLKTKCLDDMLTN